MIFKKLDYDGEYCKEVLNQKDNFNIIIIDGRDRVNSVKNGLKKLTEDGVIIFDNSELIQYKEAMDLLSKKGFKRIDFFGMSPVTAHCTTTTIFYHPNNCLGI